jgi:hypothetical protein
MDAVDREIVQLRAKLDCVVEERGRIHGRSATG